MCEQLLPPSPVMGAAELQDPREWGCCCFVGQWQGQQAAVCASDVMSEGLPVGCLQGSCLHWLRELAAFGVTQFIGLSLL